MTPEAVWEHGSGSWGRVRPEPLAGVGPAVTSVSAQGDCGRLGSGLSGKKGVSTEATMLVSPSEQQQETGMRACHCSWLPAGAPPRRAPGPSLTSLTHGGAWGDVGPSSCPRSC